MKLKILKRRIIHFPVEPSKYERHGVRIVGDCEYILTLNAREFDWVVRGLATIKDDNLQILTIVERDRVRGMLDLLALDTKKED